MTDDRSPLSQRLRRLAARYEATVSRSRADQIAGRSLARGRARPAGRLRPVPAVAMGFALTVAMLFGLVALAGSAVPGDAFYPVKRASEALGLRGDPLHERLEEVIVLAERNDRERLMVVAAEVLQEAGRRGIALPPAAPESSPAETEGDPAGDETGPPVATSAPPSTRVLPDGPAVDPEGSDEPAEPVAEAASVDAASVDAADDPVQVIRLSAEQLLRALRGANDDQAGQESVEDAVVLLAMAVDSASRGGRPTVTGPPGRVAATTTSTTSSTTTSSTTSTTTTTIPPTTTTTKPVSTTTTTTVVVDGGGDEPTQPGDDGPAQPPITLPPP